MEILIKNKKRIAFITGISGQDGSYLSEHLLELDYDVYGIIRRNSIPEHQESRISNLNVKTFYGDLLDQPSLEHALSICKPDEIYNLAAQSHVRISFDIPHYTIQTNALGVLNILEAYKKICPRARFYQASSSEMFGNSINENKYQDENTPMHPTSPYGCAKLFAYNLVKHYRRAYNLFACNGILFNHESPRRGSNFVTNKIIKTAIKIKLGLEKKLHLGNLDSYRDWGHSYDYVRAMRLIINHIEPDDFVIASGESHSVRELVQYVFNKLQLDYNKFIVIDKKYIRPEELNYLRGDSSKARKILGWKPKYTFYTMLDEMIDYWKKEYNLKD